MRPVRKPKAKLYRRFPLSSVFLYSGSTLLHFLLGATGIALGFNFTSWVGYGLGLAYLLLSLAELYVLMPLTVCPNCFYYRKDDTLCISGLNRLSRKIAKPGDPKDFPKRGRGLLCNNNLYMATLVTPVLAMIPALILNFSTLLLVIFLLVAGLLLFRFFVIFPKIGCLHCKAKYECPQAAAMGVRNL